MNLFTVHKKFSTGVKNSLALRNSKGFTLIELLVVIGILGILAASLVATIDPFEQLKKANDTKVQNATVEFQTGVVRYYTSQGGFPWDDDNDPNGCQSGGWASDQGAAGWDILAADVTDLETASSCVEDLIDIGELKQSFLDIENTMNKIFMHEENNQLIVCYLPESRAGQADKATKYSDEIGTVAGAGICKSDGGAQDCYWCTR